MIFQMTQFQAGVGHLVIGLFARRFQLPDPPLHGLVLGLDFGLFVGDFGHGRLCGLDAGLAGDGKKQGNRAAPIVQLIPPEMGRARCWRALCSALVVVV